jgi:hypothetical protein
LLLLVAITTFDARWGNLAGLLEFKEGEMMITENGKRAENPSRLGEDARMPGSGFHGLPV